MAITTTTLVPGYRNTIEITIHADGSVMAPSVIDLGAAGDNRVTLLHFNTDELDWYNSSIDDYNAMLICETSEFAELVKIKFNGSTFEVPIQLTEHSSMWKLIYVLEEKDIGNHNSYKERFVSQVMKAQITTSGMTKIFTDGVENESGNISYPSVLPSNVVTMQALAKRIIKMSFSDDYRVTKVDAQLLGYQYDRYMTQVVIPKIPNLIGVAPEDSNSDNSINHWYLGIRLLNSTNSYYIELAKGDIQKQGQQEPLISNCLACWIPPEITLKAGTYELELIGCSRTESISEAVREPDWDLVDNRFFYSKMVRLAIVENYFSENNESYKDLTIDTGTILAAETNLYSKNSAEYFVTKDSATLLAVKEV